MFKCDFALHFKKKILVENIVLKYFSAGHFFNIMKLCSNYWKIFDIKFSAISSRLKHVKKINYQYYLYFTFTVENTITEIVVNKLISTFEFPSTF